MGSYNSEYEIYYNSMVNKNKKNYEGVKNLFNLKKIYGRFVQELIGGFVLFSILLILKGNIFPQLTPVLKFSKQIVHENYDLGLVVKNIKGIQNVKAEDVQGYVSDLIEKLKVNMVGGETIKEKVKNEFGVPFTASTISPTVTSIGNTKTVDIEIAENSPVLSCYKGKVMAVGEDSKLGKYIGIDHGDGIIIKYENLNEVTLKKDEQVKKGETLGKSGKGVGNKTPHLQLEMFYMNDEINPMDYMNFSNKI